VTGLLEFAGHLPGQVLIQICHYHSRPSLGEGFAELLTELPRPPGDHRHLVIQLKLVKNIRHD
jgi:hypothetical protein